MATKIVVELTSDEQRLLEGFRKASIADDKFRAGMGKTGAAGQEAGADIVKAMVNAASQSTASLDKLIKEMKRTGEEGRFIGNDIGESFGGIGTNGKLSVKELIASMERVSPEAAEQARRSAAEWDAIDHANHFDAVLRSMGAIGDAGKVSADTLKQELNKVDRQAKFDATIMSLEALGPKGQQQAESVRKALEEADHTHHFNAVLTSLGALGGAGKFSADEIKREMNEADRQAKFDETMMSLEALSPEAREQAERLRKTFAEADKQMKLDQLLEQLRAVDEEGATVADRMKREFDQSAEKSAESLETILNKIREVDPTAADAGTRIHQEMAEAAEQSKAELDGLIERLKSMGPVGKRVADKLKDDMDAAATEATSDIGRIIKRIDEIDPAAGRNAKAIQREMENASKNGGTAMTQFKDSAIADLKSVALSYVGIHEAIQTVIDLNARVKETNRDAFEGLKGNEAGDAGLLQVSNDAADFEAMRSKADQLASDEGMSRETARELVFDARSDGFEPTMDYIAANNQIISVESQSSVAGQVPALFPHQSITGEQAIEGTLAAANESRLSFEGVSGALPSAAEGGALAGATLEETTATLGVLASRYKSADTAADRIKAFGTRVGLDEGNADIGRESLQGKGLTESVKLLQAMTPEKRKDFLGNSQEVNSAYLMQVEEMSKIDKMEKDVKAAMDAAGTDAAPTAIKRRIAAADPRLRELKKVRMSEVQLEISREETRAVEEGMKQRATNDAKTGIENQGVSKERIAAAEILTEAASLFKQGDESGMIDTLGGNDFAGLTRDLNLAVNEGDKEAGPTLLAVRKLQEARRKDPNAMVSKGSAAEYMNAMTGEQYLPDEITDEQRKSMTQSIDTQAAGSRGMYRDMTISAANLFGGHYNPFTSAALSSASTDGTSAADKILVDMMDVMKRQTAAIEKQNEIAERAANAADRTAESSAKTADASAKTAANTVPKPPRPGDAQALALAESNRRRSQQ